METEMLKLESLARSVINVLRKEKDDNRVFEYVCMQILKDYYYKDRDKFDIVVKIIKERSANDRRNREQSACGRNN